MDTNPQWYVKIMRYKAIKLCEYETAGQSPLSLEIGGERD